ncbi:MAG: hypothetical protein ACLFP7_06285 [Thiohalospira sp.]
MPTRLLIPLLAAALMTSGCAAAEPASSDEGAETIHWYEEGERRTLYVVPGRVVELGDGSAAAESAVRSARPGAEVAAEHRGARVWSVPEGEVGTRAAGDLARAAGNEARFSPLLRTAPDGGAEMALAGGVLVTLREDWSTEEGRRWLEAEGYTVEREYRFGNRFLIATPAGAEAAEVARDLHQREPVTGAAPDLWQPLETR